MSPKDALPAPENWMFKEGKHVMLLSMRNVTKWDKEQFEKLKEHLEGRD